MTRSPTIKLDTPFYEVLIRQGMNDFTVMQLRDAICDLSRTADFDDRVGAHKKAYKQILRLIKLGLIEKRKEGGKFSTYARTELFEKSHFVKAPARRRLAATQPEAINKVSGKKHQRPIADTLNETVRQYQVDLLACVGESEEYMRLFSQYPDLKAHIEPQYLSARERSSKLLGQIKAVESLLHHLAPAQIA